MRLVEPLPRLRSFRRRRPKLWTPSRRIICPRCRKPKPIMAPRRAPFWRGGTRPLNMAAGDVMLDEDGNVILDDDGDALLSDGAGDECCCGDCTECQTTSAIVSFNVVAACFGGCGVYASHNGAALSGTFTLDWVTDCEYEYEGEGPVELAVFTDVDCDPDFICTGNPTNALSIGLSFNGFTWLLHATVNVDPDGDGDAEVFRSQPFYAPGCSAIDSDCDQYCWTKTVNNHIIEEECGGGPGDSCGWVGVANHSGTATITVG